MVLTKEEYRRGFLAGLTWNEHSIALVGEPGTAFANGWGDGYAMRLSGFHPPMVHSSLSAAESWNIKLDRLQAELRNIDRQRANKVGEIERHVAEHPSRAKSVPTPGDAIETCASSREALGCSGSETHGNSNHQ